MLGGGYILDESTAQREANIQDGPRARGPKVNFLLCDKTPIPQSLKYIFHFCVVLLAHSNENKNPNYLSAGDDSVSARNSFSDKRINHQFGRQTCASLKINTTRKN